MKIIRDMKDMKDMKNIRDVKDMKWRKPVGPGVGGWVNEEEYWGAEW